MTDEKTYVVVTFSINGNPFPSSQGGPEPYQFISYCPHEHTSFEDSVECLKQTHISTRRILPGAIYTMALRDPAHMPSSTSSHGGYVRTNGSELIHDDTTATIMTRFRNEVCGPLEEQMAHDEHNKRLAKRQGCIDATVAWKHKHPIRWKLAMGRGAWSNPNGRGVRSQRTSTFLLPKELREIVLGFDAPTKEELNTGKVIE